MLTLAVATAHEADAAAVAALRTAAAEHLTELYGQGHWSAPATEEGVLRNIRTSRVLTARWGTTIVATLRLTTKKPWAIDPSYFTNVSRPLYLVDMAVVPRMQHQGVGRRLLEEAVSVARTWPADAIRLDAYAAPAGAGRFYARCGFREVARVTYRKVLLIYFERLVREG